MSEPLPILLAIEDELSIVELLTALATPIGMQLVAAANGAQATDMLERTRPLLVTLDLVLPDTSGFEVLTELRRREGFADLPIIVLSGLTDPANVRKAYALGASDFVAKPFNIDLLDAKLRVFSRLGRLVEELRQQERDYRRAARNFAHEVRNPLTAISAAAQMIVREERDRALRARMARAIEGEAERLGGLVRRYLAAQAPVLPSGFVDLGGLLGEIVEVNLLGTRARDRVVLEVRPELPRVRADADRLKQVVLNLLLNAVTATEAGGTITLHADAADSGVALAVHDTGCGISPADLPRIFDESFTTRPDGDGLGLPIARRIVEEHGGTLRAESIVGQGTTFTVWLPLS